MPDPATERSRRADLDPLVPTHAAGVAAGGRAAGRGAGRSARPRRPRRRAAGPGLAVRRRAGRLDGGGAQPPADDGRPDRDRRRRPCRTAHRLDQRAPRRRQRDRGPAARRRARAPAAARRAARAASAHARRGARVRDRDAGGPLRPRARRALPHRPFRRDDERHGLERPARLPVGRQRGHDHRRAAGRHRADRRPDPVHARPAGARRLRRRGRGGRSRRRSQRLDDALRLARDDRRRIARRLRPLGERPAVRRAVGAARGGAGLGAVPLRPLGVDPTLGLDLGRRRAVGLRAVPLRALDLSRQPVVLGARPLGRAAGVRAGARRLGRRAAGRRVGLGQHRTERRLVPARAARGLRAALPRDAELRAQRQRDPGHQHHQRHADREQPEHGRAADALRQSRRAGSGDGGAASSRSNGRTPPPSSSASPPAAPTRRPRARRSGRPPSCTTRRGRAPPRRRRMRPTSHAIRSRSNPPSRRAGGSPGSPRPRPSGRANSRCCRRFCRPTATAAARAPTGRASSARRRRSRSPSRCSTSTARWRSSSRWRASSS